MPGQPAARIGDPHVCPQVLVLVPHVGGVVVPPGAPTVLIGGQPAARVGDNCMCAVPIPNPIAKGSMVVPIMSMPAARMTDMTAHGGTIVMGCPTVLIGLAGTAGNTMVGTQMCEAAKGGRKNNKKGQSYNNCGVESSRQVINQANSSSPPVTEDGLLSQSINSGLARGTPGSPPAFANGGTNPAQRQAILAANGVQSTVQTSSPETIGAALSQGRGVVANVDASVLWPPTATAPPGSGHAITVTGIVYDEDGKVTDVVINDTGTGDCGRTVPIDQWNKAVAAHPAPRLNVTDAPIF